MTKPIKALLLALLFVTGSASAEWVQYFFVPQARITIYYDPSTLRKNKNLFTVWEIVDLKDPSASFKSARIKMEYDCVGERFRRLSGTYHSENMGKGLVLGEIKLESWQDAAPTTAPRDMLVSECAK